MANFHIKDANANWHLLKTGDSIKDGDDNWHTLKTGDAIKDGEGNWHTLSLDDVLMLSASPSGLFFTYDTLIWQTININISGNTLGWSINTVSDAWINTSVIGNQLKVLATVKITPGAALRNGTILIEADDDPTIQVIINIHQEETPL